VATENEGILRALLSAPQGAKLLSLMEKLRSVKPEDFPALGENTVELKNTASAALHGDKAAVSNLIAALSSTPEGVKLLQTVSALLNGQDEKG